MRKLYLGLKFVCDRIIALLGLLILLPLFLIISISIAIDSKGVVLFKQARSGRDGKLFNCYKFRTMHSTAVGFDIDHAVISADNSEVTRIGRILRKLKLDELPQLLNVLKGEMSLIGPRPLLPVYAETYDEWERKKFDVRPGITGLAQVNGSGLLTTKERSYYDVTYAMKANVFSDIAILFKTVGVMLCGEEKFLRHVDSADMSELEQTLRHD